MKTGEWILIGWVIAYGLLMVRPANTLAADVFQDGFEGVPASSDWTGDYDPDPAVWTATENEDKEVVVFDSTAGAEFIHGGDQAVRCVQTWTATAFDLKAEFDPVTQLSWTLWAYPQGNYASAQMRVMNLWIKGYDGELGDQRGCYFYFNSTGTNTLELKYRQGVTGVWTTLIPDIPAGQYSEYIIDADAETDRFTVTFNGDLYDNGGAGYPAYTLLETFTHVSITGGNHPFEKFYFDDFSVTGSSGPVEILGDYNGDGAVTDADYTIWADTYGSTTDLRADGNDDGTITDADYTIWADNYGTGAGSPVEVPEPMTVGLMALGFIGWIRRK